MSVLILSSHLRLDLPRASNFESTPFFHPAAWPAHPNLQDLISLTILCERYKLWSFLFSPLLDPNIRLSILFSNTSSLHSFLNTILYYCLCFISQYYLLIPSTKLSPQCWKLNLLFMLMPLNYFFNMRKTI